MTKVQTLVVSGSLAIVFAAAGCGAKDRAEKRDQQQYQVVEEGSASGVSPTLAAPGEASPPLTGTNADTTTSFTLPTVTAGQQAGTLGATFQAEPGVWTPPGAPPVTNPRPAAPRPMVSSSSIPERPRATTVEPSAVPAPVVPSETATATAPAPTLTTPTETAPTQTPPSPPPAPQQKARPQQTTTQPPPETSTTPATDTTATQAPPPPPPPDDLRLRL